ncbi:MAG: four helix bundle protein [Anaerolineales bacterium]|nr:four helix bundle protein [Anaerolineales bacterium]
MMERRPFEYKGGGTRSYGKLYGYKKLLAWQAADDLTALVFEVTKAFPRHYDFQARQMLRAASSAKTNIAEGYCRNSLGDYIRYCEIARGSLGELGSQMQDCERWQLLTDEQIDSLLEIYHHATFFLEKLIQALYRKRRNQPEWNRDLSKP